MDTTADPEVPNPFSRCEASKTRVLNQAWNLGLILKHRFGFFCCFLFPGHFLSPTSREAQ